MDLYVIGALWLGLAAAMTGAWLSQRITGNSGWIDTIWSAAVGVGGIAAAFWAAEGSSPARGVVAMVLVALWSARLALHIAGRTAKSGDDPRYAALMKEWGPAAPLRLFLFLQIQAVCAGILVLAVYVAASNTAPFPRFIDVLAIVVALVAIVGEAVSDAQLAKFRASPDARSGVCETGLWAYSRHPNYFFEWLGWCAWPLLAFNLASPLGWGTLALLAPMLMYWLLVHVSGIPPLEEHMLRSRGEAFRSLQSRVNAFFPGPRRAATRTANL